MRIIEKYFIVRIDRLIGRIVESKNERHYLVAGDLGLEIGILKEKA